MGSLSDFLHPVQAKKTEKRALLKEFAKGKPALYYMATKLPETQQLKRSGEMYG